MRLNHLIVPLLLLAGCAPFPDLDGSIPDAARNADFPELRPVEPILARAAVRSPDTDKAQGLLEARVAALNARADRLRNISADR